jgi:ribose-phosphate pyrophosphokinase
VALKLFALGSSKSFGETVARELRLRLAPHEERDFEDGEHKSRPLESVRGAHVYVLSSLYGEARESPNDKLAKLLFFLGAVRDAGAERVTAVVPYLCYARKDRKTQPRDPVTTRYVAGLFEAVGVDRVVVLDVHNLQAFQNAFRCRTEHLEARMLFVEHLAPILGSREAVVVSPDAGAMKRADDLRSALARRLEREVPVAFLEKERALGVVRGGALVGDVRGRVAVVVDDLIATGTTLARAAAACRELGATTVHAVATHGLFVGGAAKALADPALETIAVTNSVPPFRLEGSATRGKLTVLDAAPLIAQAIARLHSNGSLVELGVRGALATPAPF